MDSSSAASPPLRPWLSLWLTALASLLAQLGLCQFFSFGERVPMSIDVDASNLWKYAYHFPPRGEFLTLNWFGIPNLPPTLSPFSLAAAHLSTWVFFTAYTPVIATLALLAMAAFLREMEIPRPAALFGAVIYAWQGDLLPFVFPGHYGYITMWPFFALGAWGALRAQRTRQSAYSLIAGASCGLMVGMQPDRGGMASLLIALLYLAPALAWRASWPENLRQLLLCAALALLVSLAALLALFQSYIVGVKMGASSDRDQTFSIATEFSLGPAEALTYLVPGFFGWHSSNPEGPYWGWIGQTPDWPKTHAGRGNLNLAISSTGTVATLLAVLGAWLLLPRAYLEGAEKRFDSMRRRFRPLTAPPADAPQINASGIFSERQIFFARLLLFLGAVAMILSWGYHTPLYRPLFALPLMDKWRDPVKWLEITDFALITLAALGLQCLLASLDPAQRKWRGPLHVFFALMTGLLALGLLASYPLAIPLAANLTAAAYDGPAVANVMRTLHVSLLFALALAGLSWLVLAGAWRADWLRRWEIVNPLVGALWTRMLAPNYLPATLAVVLALLAVVQLRWVATQFIEPADLAELTSTNSLLEALKAEGNRVRVAVPAPQDPILNYYLQNQFAADRISSSDISAASRIPDDLGNFLGALEGHPARLWFLAGVKNVAVAQQMVARLHQAPEVAANVAGADGYTLAEAHTGDQPSHALIRMRDYLQKATFVPRAEVIPDEDHLLKRLSDPAWNPRETVLLSAPPPGLDAKVGTGAKPGPVTVNVTHYTAHEIRLQVEAPSMGYVLINDQFNPDWQAEVEGRPVTVLRADYMFRAIPVEAGTSSIVLRYVAHYRLAGLTIPVVAMNLFSDGVVLVAWIVAGLMLWRTPKRRA